MVFLTKWRRALALFAALMAAGSAHAASGGLADKIADVLAVMVLIIVPVVAIVLFWMVHVLPEKIAHKRHHPQRDAITTLCLLSLVFGGLLWPIAWLWAYTRPVGYRMAYGTDKGPDYYTEMAQQFREGKLSPQEVRYLHEDLEAMDARGALTPGLLALKDALEADAAARTGSVAAAREGTA